MTRISTIILLPLALVFGACDREDTANAEPNDDAVESADGKEHGRGRGGLKKLDVDGDGMISLAEAKDHRIAGKFAELDADGDGKLSKDELHARKGRHGKGHDKGHGWKHKDPAERAAHFMAKFDADRDGALTPAELAAKPHLAEKFAELDADKNGKLSVAEVTAFKAEHHGKGHDKGRGRGHDKGRGRGHDGDRGGPQAAG